MRYCTACSRITPGDPSYCGTCGCSYDVRLCKSGHRNPRSAQVCSQCGSKELSTPQPKRSVFVRLLIVFLRMLPAFLVLATTVALFYALAVAVIRNEQWLIGKLICYAMWVVVFWIIFLMLPKWIQQPFRAVGRSVGRRLIGSGKETQKRR